ncbi:uncharacterized protein LOC102808440 [Saccoglossus kowalevskii]|uniref:Uncharacterized protein LOC102808440 n=1 Tax=Saccoglossus kowalevskii TaxID=10224 RepID=A0ABM0MWU5_SACKO|nr:PREDICTED: uncharacterized protein LOC102808440 [Saccoglossus kowalevskii]
MLKKQFVPHIARLCHLLNKRLDNAEEHNMLRCIADRPLLTMYSIKSICQLQSFFNTLVHIHQTGGSTESLSLSQSSSHAHEFRSSQSLEGSHRISRQDSMTSVVGKTDDADHKHSDPMLFIERMIERDFLDPLVQ